MRLRFERGRPDELETLHPSYFALVMATGIVSIATDMHGVPVLPTVLFWLNAAFLFALLTANGARVLYHARAVVADVASHSRGVGYFTAVAALGVFGTELLVQMRAVGLATVFWVVTSVVWLVITYGVLTVLTVKLQKPGLAEGINGGWLVIVVATQSVSVLTVLMLAVGVSKSLQQPLMFFSLVLWIGGGALYLWLITLIFFRYTFFPMKPEDMTPPYWINMGAVAISTLSGSNLLEHAALSPVVASVAPFVKGLTLSYWAVGTWWIPMLVILGIWRYLIRGVPFAYDPLDWGGVFPLGMYSACTYHLAQILDADFLMPLSSVFMVLAVIAWVVAFVGLIESRLARGTSAQSV